MSTRHTDPYVRDREVREVREDSSSPMMLIIGLLLAAAIIVAAWFAFTGNDNEGPVINEGDTNNTEQVVPGGDTGDSGTTGGTGDSGGFDSGDTTTTQ